MKIEEILKSQIVREIEQEKELKRLREEARNDSCIKTQGIKAIKKKLGGKKLTQREKDLFRVLALGNGLIRIPKGIKFNYQSQVSKNN